MLFYVCNSIKITFEAIHLKWKCPFLLAYAYAWYTHCFPSFFSAKHIYQDGRALESIQIYCYYYKVQVITFDTMDMNIISSSETPSLSFNTLLTCKTFFSSIDARSTKGQTVVTISHRRGRFSNVVECIVR